MSCGPEFESARTASAGAGSRPSVVPTRLHSGDHLLIVSQIAGRLRTRPKQENPAIVRDSSMARPGLEPGTPRFSVVRSSRAKAAESLEDNGFARMERRPRLPQFAPVSTQFRRWSAFRRLIEPALTDGSELGVGIRAGAVTRITHGSERLAPLRMTHAQIVRSERPMPELVAPRFNGGGRGATLMRATTAAVTVCMPQRRSLRAPLRADFADHRSRGVTDAKPFERGAG